MGLLCLLMHRIKIYRYSNTSMRDRVSGLRMKRLERSNGSNGSNGSDGSDKLDELNTFLRCTQMQLATVYPLLIFVTVATISPGGATTLATASGAKFGFIDSIPLMLGIALGLASLAAVAAAGLAGFLVAVPALQLAMKTGGSAYLLFLAWKIANAGAPSGRAESLPGSTPTSLLGGACLLWLNPKGWAMALGAAASFASVAGNPLQLSAVLGAAFGVAACLSLGLWCIGGIVLARLLKTPAQWRILNLAMASLLVISIIPIWT
jgi:threonine/homoserine/homoserine lactone efflux protein